MSALYGSLKGSRGGEATKAGHDSIEGHLRGWENGVRVFGRHKAGRGDSFEIYRTSGSHGTKPDILLGTVKEDGTFEPAK